MFRPHIDYTNLIPAGYTAPILIRLQKSDQLDLVENAPVLENRRRFGNFYPT
jgi:hypothetical protein